MTAVWATSAVLVPWLAGTMLVRIACGHSEVRWWAVGAGWFAGQSMVMAALYFTLAALGSGHAHAVLLTLAGAAAAGRGVIAARPARLVQPP